MSEINSQPEYVAYPRDLRFREFDAIDRLESVGQGYLNLTWAGIFVNLVDPYLQHKSILELVEPINLVFNLLIVTVSFLILRSALSKIFFGKGWNPALALGISVLLCCYSVAIALLPHRGVGVILIFYAPWLVLAFATRRIVSAEFRKFDVKMGWRLEDKKLKAIIQTLREKESRVVPFNEPRPAENF